MPLTTLKTKSRKSKNKKPKRKRKKSTNESPQPPLKSSPKPSQTSETNSEAKSLIIWFRITSYPKRNSIPKGDSGTGRKSTLRKTLTLLRKCPTKKIKNTTPEATLTSAVEIIPIPNRKKTMDSRVTLMILLCLKCPIPKKLISGLKFRPLKAKEPKKTVDSH
jgi:hypothetical protein